MEGRITLSSISSDTRITMTRTFRLAVLECDTPFPSVNASRGSYGNIFRDLLVKGLDGLGEKGSDVSLDLSKWDVVTAQEYPNVDDVDGFLLTGSSMCHTSLSLSCAS